jgi:hypothetical protein
MPVKRRRPKRRLDDAAELAVWFDVFETGFAFFGEFEAVTGIPTTDIAAVRAAASEAWRRLGNAFLAQWTPTLSQPVAWAAAELGVPRRCP